MIARALLIPIALLLSSCITFTSQTMAFRYDRQADRLYIFQLYEGIYGDEKPSESAAQADLRPAERFEINESEREQLVSVIAGQRTFLFDNWILQFNRKDIEELTAQIETRGERSELDEYEISLTKQALATVKIRNGAFFLNAQHRLSGYQYVTIDKFSGLLQAFNRTFSAGIRSIKPGQKILDLDVSETSQALLRQAAASDFAWVKINGNQLIFTLPLTYADYLAQRQNIAVGLRKDLLQSDKIEKRILLYTDLFENDLQILFADNAAILRVGHPESPFTKIFMRLSGDYRPNAVAFAQRYRTSGAADIGALIEQLGDRDMAVRERAAAALRKQGAWAYPQLKLAAHHDNPEIALHARALLKIIDRSGPEPAERTAPPAEVDARMRRFLSDGTVVD